MQPDVVYDADFLSEKESEEVYSWIMDNVQWTQVQYNKYNKIIKTPRLTTCFGFHNEDIPQEYEGYNPEAIPPYLMRLKDKVEKATGSDYNYILMSYYRDGNDSISYHSDDERFLGKNPVIASLSLGQERRFLLKHKDTGERHTYQLENGSLMVMQGNTQHDWLHSIPKTKRKMMPRINITFRKMKIPYGTKNYYHYNRGVLVNTS